MIYFLRASPFDYVKIGYSRDEVTLQNRISTLQTSMPWKLELLRVIDPAEQWVESMLHEIFAPQRHTGEWFTYTPAMMDITPDGWWTAKRKGGKEARAAVASLVERLVNLLDDWTPYADEEAEADDEPEVDDELSGDEEPDADEYMPIKFRERVPAPFDQYLSEDDELSQQSAFDLVQTNV